MSMLSAFELEQIEQDRVMWGERFRQMDDSSLTYTLGDIAKAMQNAVEMVVSGQGRFTGAQKYWVQLELGLAERDRRERAEATRKVEEYNKAEAARMAYYLRGPR